ncbi:MAG: hypothetical protein VYE15_03550 [Myxococcota bacterium]|nr:hypothetical protein [Myxococcota bacterium]
MYNLDALSADPQGSSSSLPIAEGEGWRLRCAGESDRETLVTLLDEIPFGAPSAFVEHRGEDILALRRAQLAGFRPKPTAFILETPDGEPIGCFSVSVRSRPRPGAVVEQAALGVIGDLRIRREHRGGEVLAQALARAVDHTRVSHAVDYFSMAVVSSDIYSLAPFLRRETHRFAQPMSQVVVRHALAYLPLGKKVRHRTERNHQWAHPDDREELLDFIVRGQAGRRFGILYDDDLLRAREKAWSGFSVDRFYVVRGREGQIAACAAPWDPGDLRRLSRVRPGFFGRSHGLGSVPAGRPLKLSYLTHLCCDPVSLGPAEDLLRGLCNELADEGQDGLVVMTPMDGAVHRALEELSATVVPVSILGLTAAGTSQNTTNLRAPDVGLESVFL